MRRERWGCEPLLQACTAAAPELVVVVRVRVRVVSVWWTLFACASSKSRSALVRPSEASEPLCATVAAPSSPSLTFCRFAESPSRLLDEEDAGCCEAAEVREVEEEGVEVEAVATEVDEAVDAVGARALSLAALVVVEAAGLFSFSFPPTTAL